MMSIPLHRISETAGAQRREALEGLGDAARWALATLRAWRRRIAERGQLAKLDERMLCDIGLSRADAEFLINKPFWRE